MNLFTHSAKIIKKLQVISQTCGNEVSPHLPQNLELLAKSLLEYCKENEAFFLPYNF